MCGLIINFVFRALLPSYRAAPDYDTAIQQKYSQRPPVHYGSHQSHSHAHPNPLNPAVYGSQPEIHRPVHYPDVTRHTAALNTPIDLAAYGLSPATQETPYAAAFPTGLLPAEVPQQYLNVYKPPPPYPSGMASNSTPDLAVASQSMGLAGYHRGYISPHVSGSSPDLVSSRFLSTQYMSHLNGGNPQHVLGYQGQGQQKVMPSAHGTYENLASVMDVPNRHIIIESPHLLPNHIQKLHDERGNLIYCVPTTQVPYRSHMVLPTQKLNPVSDSQEPIYENVPLPWQNEPTRLAARDRAQSLTSPPDVSKLVERKVSQPISIVLSGDQSPLVPSPGNINVTGGFPAAFNPNVQLNNVKYSPDSLYVNAQIIKSNNNVSYLANETKVILNNKTLSKTDLQDLTNSMLSVAISKESLAISNAEVGSNASLKGSTSSSIRSSSQVPVIQQSDSNNITTITINSHDDNQPLGIVKSSGTFTKSKSLSDNLHDDSHLSMTSTVHSGFDMTGPTSSFFNSTHQSSAYDMETSGLSSTTSGSIPGKEKKRRRWGIFVGKSSKSEIKSATLGRDRAKKEKNSKDTLDKHRWSTALPKSQPLPPSISKETMVIICS